MASRVLGAFVVTGTAVLASLALATPASAHTPVVSASCDEKTQKTSLTVDLTRYGTEKKNTLTVFIDDVKQDPTVTFGASHNETGWESDGKSDHVYKVSIKAYDDPQARNGWTKEITLPKTDKCVQSPPKPEQPKPEQPQPPVVTTTEAPSSSVTPPAPGGSTPEPPLAATGASPMWLLLSGLGLVGAGAGTLLFLRRRRSA